MSEYKKLIGTVRGNGAPEDLTVGLLYWIHPTGEFLDDVGYVREEKYFTWEEDTIKPPEDEAVASPNRAGKADRFNAGKPQLSYMLDAPRAMIGLTKAFEAGAKKYSRDNWKKGLDRYELIDCLMRHLLKAQAGQLNDEETGVNHLNHVLWNALVLADQFNGEEFGDE